MFLPLLHEILQWRKTTQKLLASAGPGKWDTWERSFLVSQKCHQEGTGPGAPHCPLEPGTLTHRKHRSMPNFQQLNSRSKEPQLCVCFAYYQLSLVAWRSFQMLSLITLMREKMIWGVSAQWGKVLMEMLGLGSLVQQLIVHYLKLLELNVNSSWNLTDVRSEAGETN